MSSRESIFFAVHRLWTTLCVALAAFSPLYTQGVGTSFVNPILDAPSQDPWIIQHDSTYYYCESRGRSITIRRSVNIIDLRHRQPARVWKAPERGPTSDNIWAPELHELDGRWYLYFAADDGNNAHHRMWVIRADNPMGPYGEPILLETHGWAIDGTVLRSKSKLHFVWSGWPDTVDGMQQLFIAPMKDPTTISGPRRLLTSPTESWERHGMPICEGPAVLWRGTRTFIVYSAGGSWTRNYCLGMLVNDGGDLMDPRSWRKSGPVFSSTQLVFGVGHCSFTLSPDRREPFILFHAKATKHEGWMDRRVHAQRFDWSADGLPVFGKPIAPGEPISLPSSNRLLK